MGMGKQRPETVMCFYTSGGWSITHTRQDTGESEYKCSHSVFIFYDPNPRQNRSAPKPVGPEALEANL